MKIGTIIKIISVSFVLMVGSFVFLIVSNAREQNAVTTQATFKQLGLDFSRASDFLTEQARCYVQYAERKYYNAYMEEVEVNKTREHVVAELTRLGAPQEELAMAQQALQLSNTLAELEGQAFEAVGNWDMENARQMVFGAEYENGKKPITSTMEQFQTTMAERTTKAAETAKAQARIALICCSVLLVAVAVIVIISLLVIQKKLKLVAALADSATKLADGDTNIDIDTTSTDEIGVLAQAFRTMVDSIQEQVRIAEHLASGDLTLEVRPRSSVDAMGIALQKMLGSLNNMFSQINQTTTQVFNASQQISGSAQALAQGSTEQAGSVQQLSSSIAEVSQKTKDNADLAERAALLSNTVKDSAEKGSRQMDQMMQAVKEIGEASSNISKVIKVIDDIAFQTNILALNAAVEAARAGQHGKGFAVVAEEVRSLASKSADAARDTGVLIANSMEKAELGVRIASETADSLTEIVAGIKENSQIVGDIAKSSEEQTVAIGQINKGIDQVTQVVNQNSATAEESAASSEQMSGQANILKELVARFKIKEDETLPPALGAAPLNLPEASMYYKDNIGKY